MAKIGYSALVIALVTSIYASIAFLFGVNPKGARTLESARRGLLAVAVLLTVSVAVLLYAIFTHNFQLEYVASYTSLNLAPIYLLSAFWAGNSGSLLFWAWLLALFALVVALREPRSSRELVPHALMVLMVAEAFFLILMVRVASPFNELPYAPPDGRGLNPLLENIGMVFHPPALLAGYVAFTVPFAFAISGLILGKTRGEWLTLSRRWTLLAWLLLGIGNLIGAWWAYVELGWGGYWMWDPVENAGLMPWLVATAFLHSAIMEQRRGIFRVWNIVLMVMTFILVIFGTFLTRSGVLSSVHAFGESSMTPYFVAFMGVTLFGSLLLLYYRYGELRGTEETGSLVSREGTFLLNNLLFLGATLAILFGAIFPLISEAVGGVKVSLDASFFNRVENPLFLIIILLSGICTVIGWRQESLKRLSANLFWPLVAAVSLGVVLFITAIREPQALLAFSICSFAFFSVLSDWLKGTMVRHRVAGENYLKAFWDLLWSNTQRYGGYIVHIGIILIAAGVIGSSFYDVEREATLGIGDSITIKNYFITYDGMDSRETPDKAVVSARLSIYNSEKLIGKLVSEKYFHRSLEQPVTEVGIRYGFSEDVYIILAGWEKNGVTADFIVKVNPLVSWIWVGGAVSLLGGLVAFSPGRQIKPKGSPLPSEAKV